MRIESLAEYERALQELSNLERAEDGPEARRRQELEAAVASFAERERADPELERGRPPGTQAPKQGEGQVQGDGVRDVPRRTGR